MNLYRIFLFAYVFSFSYFANAQGGFTSNNSELEYLSNRFEIENDSTNLFTGVRPFQRRQISEFVNQKAEKLDYVSSLEYLNRENQDFGNANEGKFNAFYRDKAHFISHKVKDFYYRINPIGEFKMGKESENTDTKYQIYRGVEIMGNLDKSLNFYLQVSEHGLKPMQYVTDYGNGFNGQNSYQFNPLYTYWMDDNGNRKDFSNSIGYLEYSKPKFSIMIGHDRNHYGYGYRSLFLGDEGAPYFQLKTNFNFWKFHYQILFAQFTGQYIRGADRLLPKKYGAFHLLTFKPSKKLDIGVFESIIFHRNDGFDLNYLNPVIFYHTLEYQLGSPDNSMIGLQAKYNFNSHTQIYSQLLLDDIHISPFLKGTGWWSNKYGAQLGGKIINILNIPHLDIQLEANLVRPYTYSHHNNDNTDTIDNFTHYNQPLAHPFGANFIEIFSKISYKPIEKIKLELKYDFNIRGLDYGGDIYGNNIFANTNANNIPKQLDNTLLQGNRQVTHFLLLSSQYQFYHNLFFDLDFIYRNSNSELGLASSTIGAMAGIRINLKKRDYIF